MEEHFQIYIQADKPYPEDPDPTSSLIFQDKGGSYYRVFGHTHNEQLDTPNSGNWEIREAIRKTIQGRATSLLVAV